MSKVDSFNTVSSGYNSIQQLNENFDIITTAFENTLSRDGSSPNVMNSDLDMNGYNILNASIVASGSSSDSFKTISVSGQSDVVADSSTDTLTFIAGANITLTTNPSTDSITITSAISGGTTVADGDYGDIVASGSGTILTIDNTAVTLGKMANVGTGTVFYRKSVSTGSPETQTLATLKTDLGLTGTNTGDQTITLTGDVTGTGTGTFAATIGAGKVLESMLGLTDVTTANASTSQHGLLKKLDNNAAHFMDGTGAWSTPNAAVTSESKTTVSAATNTVITVDFTTYSAYRVYISNYTGVNSDNRLFITFSQDAGSNYRTSTYAWKKMSSTTFSTTTGDGIPVIGTGSLTTGCIVIDIIQPSTTLPTHFTAISSINPGGAYQSHGGGSADSSAAVNRLKIADSDAGNFSAIITVIPIAKR